MNSMSDSYKKYRQYRRRKIMFMAGTGLLLVVFMFVGLGLGAAGLSMKEIWEVIAGGGSPLAWQIVWNIRLPRVLSAVMAGVALSVAGAVMQSILRNPLGSPFTLGISNAAAFGAAVAVVIFGAGSTRSYSNEAVLIINPYLITVCAFVSSLVATGIIIGVSRIRGASPETMILTGIMAGSLFLAGTTALQYFATDVQLAAIVFWTFGDLGRAAWREFWIMLAVVVPSLVYFIYNRWNYNSLDAGDETARSLGVNVERVRITGMVIASVSTAVAVSFFGIIAFVGLVVPHIVRAFIGSDERFLIPGSALFGGLFLLVADTAARTIISPVVLPVGILTSFIGAPLFLFLLVSRKRRSQW